MFIGGYVYRKWYKRFLAAILDITGWLFLGIFRLLKPPFSPQKVKKILVVRLDHLGDVIMTRPAVDALRKAFPNAQIDLLMSSHYDKLMVDDKSISNVISFKYSWFDRKIHPIESFMEAIKLIGKIQNEHYDLGIDFRGDLRNITMLFLGGARYRIGYGFTGGRFMLSEEGEIFENPQHQIDQNMELLKKIYINEEPQIRAFDVKEHSTEVTLPKVTDNQKLVMIHPGSGDPVKRWSSNNFKKLVHKLLEDESVELVIVGTKDEKENLDLPAHKSRITDIRGKTNLNQLPLLLNRTDLFIGNDSGPAHLAGVQGVESVLIFGGQNSPEVWKPRGNKVHLFEPAFDVEVEQVVECVQNLLRETHEV